MARYQGLRILDAVIPPLFWFPAYWTFICLAFKPLPISAQISAHHLSPPSCSGCRISLKKVATIGDADGPGAIGGVSTFVRLYDGSYALSYDGADAEFMVFSPTGAFVKRIGKRGSGPGEYQFIRFLRPVGKALHVFDARLHRETVLDSQFRVTSTRNWNINALGDTEVLRDGRVVSNAIVRTQDRIGFALHILENGEASKSFAPGPGGFRYDISPLVFFRSVSVYGDDIWSFHRTRYQIDRFDTRGKAIASFARDVRWFVPHLSAPQPPDPSRPPAPFIVDGVATGNVLWIAIRVADRRWPQALSPTPRGSDPERGKYFIDNETLAYDTVIEAIDASAARVLVSIRVDEVMFEFTSGGQIVSAKEDADGNPQLQVWQMTLHQPSRR